MNNYRMKAYAAAALLMAVCQFPTYGKAPKIDTKACLATALSQTNTMYEKLAATGQTKMPNSLNNGKIVYVNYEAWTSGFYPGTLWYLSEMTDSPLVAQQARILTERMERIKNLTHDHDIGFRIGCSYGNAYRLTGNGMYKGVIVQAARSLSTRFQPGAGVIMSWNPGNRWRCPVIIDNMMNLELLFNAAILSGDSSFYRIAVSHADRTLENHFRPDHSSFHVIDYDPQTGEVLHRNTAQGYADGSAWSRGQSWGLYGFTMCYRFTRDERYLRQAEAIADLILTHPNMPADGVPYWDYDAPNIPNEERDASAGAIAASALYELSLYSDKKYAEAADRILASLASPAYLAKPGENGNFLLMHSVGARPAKSEVDVPIIYADYYFMEALFRHKNLKKLPKLLWDARIPV